MGGVITDTQHFVGFSSLGSGTAPSTNWVGIWHDSSVDGFWRVIKVINNSQTDLFTLGISNSASAGTDEVIYTFQFQLVLTNRITQTFSLYGVLYKKTFNTGTNEIVTPLTSESFVIHGVTLDGADPNLNARARSTASFYVRTLNAATKVLQWTTCIIHAHEPQDVVGANPDDYVSSAFFPQFI